MYGKTWIINHTQVYIVFFSNKFFFLACLFRQKSSIGTICSPANVCCVQFSENSSHQLVFGSANYKIYGYDLRHIRTPLYTLAGHKKAVSYVKFVDAETLVSASTDNTLKLWDLKKNAPTGVSTDSCSLTFTGHANEKVGCSGSSCKLCFKSIQHNVSSFLCSELRRLVCFRRIHCVWLGNERGKRHFQTHFFFPKICHREYRILRTH